jgi:hypothetical protein
VGVVVGGVELNSVARWGFTAVDQLGLGFKQRPRFWLPGLSVGGIAAPVSCLACLSRSISLPSWVFWSGA